MPGRTGGSRAKRKGSLYENELANILWEQGFAVVRGPSSGGGVRRRFQPDLVAMRGGVILVFEVKTAGEKPLYIDGDKVRRLAEFARRAGARAFIAVRVKGGGWRFHSLESLEETVGGNFKLAKPLSGLRLEGLRALVEGWPRLTDFISEG
ncbi:Holliday junction resolvase Hjc [Stetteria hydrogenophila]